MLLTINLKLALDDLYKIFFFTCMKFLPIQLLVPIIDFFYFYIILHNAHYKLRLLILVDLELDILCS